jgi:hypothetical protein
MSITEEISKYITLAFYAYQNYPQWKAYLKENGPDINGRIKKITDAYFNIVEQELPPDVRRRQIQDVYEEKRYELLNEINDIILDKGIPFKKESIARFLENNPEVIELIRELMLNEAMYMRRDSYTKVKYSRDPNNPGKEIKTVIGEEPIDIYQQLPTNPNSYTYVLMSILGDPTEGGVDLTRGFTNVTDDELNAYLEELKFEYRQKNPGSSDINVSKKELDEYRRIMDEKRRNEYLETIRNASPGSSLASDDSLYENERYGNENPDNIDYGAIDYGADLLGIQDRKRKSENESDNGRKSRKTTEGGRRTRRTRKGRKGRKGKARKTKRGRKQRRTKRR